MRMHACIHAHNTHIHARAHARTHPPTPARAHTHTHTLTHTHTSRPLETLHKRSCLSQQRPTQHMKDMSGHIRDTLRHITHVFRSRLSQQRPTQHMLCRDILGHIRDIRGHIGNILGRIRDSNRALIFTTQYLQHLDLYHTFLHFTAS